MSSSSMGPGMRVNVFEGVSLELAERWAKALDEHCCYRSGPYAGLLKVMPASFYDGVDPVALVCWCTLRGFYCLPTEELIDFLRQQTQGLKTIEIGAGGGCIARALRVPATDSHLQIEPIVAEIYRRMGQATVKYGPDVEKLSAAEAIEKYRPEAVIGAWVTHCYRADRRDAGGNVDGIDEEAILSSVRRYIVVGNMETHELKPIRALPHESFAPRGLFARKLSQGGNRVWVWEGSEK